MTTNTPDRQTNDSIICVHFSVRHSTVMRQRKFNSHRNAYFLQWRRGSHMHTRSWARATDTHKRCCQRKVTNAVIMFVRDDVMHTQDSFYFPLPFSTWDIIYIYYLHISVCIAHHTHTLTYIYMCSVATAKDQKAGHINQIVNDVRAETLPSSQQQQQQHPTTIVTEFFVLCMLFQIKKRHMGSMEYGMTWHLALDGRPKMRRRKYGQFHKFYDTHSGCR